MKKVLRFTAKWCQPCKIYAPIFEKVASEIPGVAFETIDVDTGDPRVMEYGVRSIPTTIILNMGEVMDRETGVVSEQRLKQMIR